MSGNPNHSEAAAPPVAPELPWRDTIEGDFACEQCDYNLRGLKFDGTCPECGAPIRTRLPGGPLLLIARVPEARWREYAWRRWPLLMVCLLVFIVCGMTVAMSAQWPGVYVCMGMPVWVAIMFAPFTWHSCRDDAKSFQIVLGVHALTLKKKDSPTLRFAKAHIKKIEEDQYGLDVQAKSRRGNIRIPIEVEHFDAIRGHLANWRSIEPQPRWLYWVLGPAIILGLNALAIGLGLAGHPWITTIAGLVSIGLGIVVVVILFRDRTMLTKFKILSILIILTALVLVAYRITDVMHDHWAI